MSARLQEVVNAASGLLEPVSNSPRLDAELLLADLLGKNREFLLSHHDWPISRAVIKAFEWRLGQRLEGMPIAQIRGLQDFFGLPIAVTPEVLVPRPATELLVEHLLANRDNIVPGAIADIGTGSGAIALAIADKLPTRSIIGTDVDWDALRLAAANARRLRLDGRVQWRHGSLLSPVDAEPLAAVIANLPYLNDAQMEEPSIQNEPAQALYGGPTGRELIERLLAQLARRTDWQLLVLEFDPSQADELRAELETRWPDAAITEISDGESVRGFGLRR